MANAWLVLGISITDLVMDGRTDGKIDKNDKTGDRAEKHRAIYQEKEKQNNIFAHNAYLYGVCAFYLRVLCIAISIAIDMVALTLSHS